MEKKIRQVVSYIANHWYSN